VCYHTTHCPDQLFVDLTFYLGLFIPAYPADIPMSKNEYSSTSSLSCCDSCYNCMGSTGLQILNLLDFVVGITMVLFGFLMLIYLSSNQLENVNVRWIYLASFVLGSTVLVISLLSFVAVTSADCRKAVIPASYLSLAVAVFALITAIAQLIWHAGFIDYIDDEEANGDVDGGEADSLKLLYTLTTIMNFFEVISSSIRFGGSRAFYNSSVKVDKDFTNTLLAHDRSMDEKYDANRTKVYAKYDGLRDHYRSKYVEPPLVGGSSSTA